MRPCSAVRTRGGSWPATCEPGSPHAAWKRSCVGPEPRSAAPARRPLPRGLLLLVVHQCREALVLRTQEGDIRRTLVPVPRSEVFLVRPPALAAANPDEPGLECEAISRLAWKDMGAHDALSRRRRCSGSKVTSQSLGGVNSGHTVTPHARVQIPDRKPGPWQQGSMPKPG